MTDTRVTDGIVSLRLDGFQEVLLTSVGVEFTADVDPGRWRELGRRLSFLERSSAWSVGDWASYGEAHFPEEYADEIAAESGYATESVRVCQWVAERVSRERRRPALTWSHHRAVAALEVEEQESWLSAAEAENLSTRELHEKIKQSAGAGVMSLNGSQSSSDVPLESEIREALRGWVLETALERAVGDVLRVLKARGIES